MKFAILVLFFICTLRLKTEALRCWTCRRAKSNFDCQRSGKLEACLSNENACHNEIRRGSHGLRVTKRCKQELACSNNQIQNPKAAWDPTQCNARVPSSVCRCCCKTDGCNADMMCRSKEEIVLDCSPLRAPRYGRKSCDFVRRANEVGSTCRFTCNQDYRRVGASRSVCRMTPGRRGARFNAPTPACVFVPKDCRPVQPPLHGLMNCTNGVKPGSVCSFGCNDFFVAEEHDHEDDHDKVIIPSAHELEGEKEIRCQPNGRWTAPPPTCVAVTCPDLQLSDKVELSCSFANLEGSVCSFKCEEEYELIGSSSTTCDHVPSGGVWTNPVPSCRRIECEDYPFSIQNGSFSCTDDKYLHSACQFTCESGHRLVGAGVTQCIQENEKTFWNYETPTCERIRCPSQFLRNGRISCTNENYENSVCSYECVTEDFSLDPPEVTSATCMENAMWNVSKPCCSRICPPYSVVDVVFAIDSSSSIGSENWIKIKSFVESLIKTFAIGEDAARVGAFRYNRYVDMRSQILLGDYPSSKSALLRAFDRIPYNGKGTFTGQALLHARNVMFHPANGNRPDVPDYLIVITDGTSFDSISLGARLLREDHVHVFAIGVLAQDGRLNYNQLRELVTHEEDLIIVEEGFDDLDENLFSELVHIVCHPGCEVD